MAKGSKYKNKKVNKSTNLKEFMEIKVAKPKDVVDIDKEVIVWKFNDITTIEKIDPKKILDILPYLEGAEAEKLALEAKKWARKEE